MLQSYKLADIMVTVSGPTESAWRIVSAWAVKGFDLLISRNISVVLAHRAYPLYLLSVRTLNFYAKGMPRRLAEDLDDRETVRQALSRVRPHIVLDVKQSTGKRQGEGIMWIWEIMG